MADRPTSPSQHPAVPAYSPSPVAIPGTQPGVTAVGQAGPDRVRCVLWHAAGAAMPGELLSTLSKRISHFTFCTDAYAALAHVCAIERERREARARGEAGAHAASLLVIIEPGELPEFAEVVGAVGLYAPGATLRRWRRGANPRFAPVVEGGMDTPQIPSTVVIPKPVAAPGLRLAGAAAERAAVPIHRPWSGGAQLSEDELRMLLEDEPPAAGGAGGGRP